jgi:hypothetical protein
LGLEIGTAEAVPFQNSSASWFASFMQLPCFYRAGPAGLSIEYAMISTIRFRTTWMRQPDRFKQRNSCRIESFALGKPAAETPPVQERRKLSTYLPL